MGIALKELVSLLQFFSKTIPPCFCVQSYEFSTLFAALPLEKTFRLFLWKSLQNSFVESSQLSLAKEKAALATFACWNLKQHSKVLQLRRFIMGETVSQCRFFNFQGKLPLKTLTLHRLARRQCPIKVYKTDISVFLESSGNSKRYERTQKVLLFESSQWNPLEFVLFRGHSFHRTSFEDGPVREKLQVAPQCLESLDQLEVRSLPELLHLKAIQND